MHLGAEFLQPIGEGLGPPAAGMDDHQQCALGEVSRRPLDEGHRVLARLGGRFQDDDTLVGEQRRAEQLGDLADADLPGPQAVDRDIAGAR